MTRSALATAAIVFAILGGCSTLDTSGLSDGTAPDAAATAIGDGGANDHAEIADAQTPPRCTCAPSAPVSWTGPFVLYDGPPNARPSCPSGTTQTLSAHADLQAAKPAPCGACTCGAPENACSAGSVTVSPDGNAAGVCSTGCTAPVSGASCVICPPALPFYALGLTVNAVASPITGGTCAPTTAKAPPLPVVDWGRSAIGCASTTTGQCAAPTACIPALPPPFQAHACIERAGDVACPSDVFTQKLSYFASMSDTRACSACTCGDPSGVACTLQGRVNVGLQCDGSPTKTIPVTSGCTGFSGAAYYGFDVVGVATAGSCAPSGGAPIGEVKPSDPVTVCCMP